MKTVMALILSAVTGLTYAADTPLHRQEYTTIDGLNAVRSITSFEGVSPLTAARRLPIRNPQILAQVLWVDRAHEYAIADRVAITPDGSGMFAGWYLNNERFSAYVSTGLQSPAWSYRYDTDNSMPVAASDIGYVGTDVTLPVLLWDRNSPLYTDQYDFAQGYICRGVAFSGDGNMLAAVGQNGLSGQLVVYDVEAQDTVYTRAFEVVTALNGVDISKDGSTVVVSNYGNLLVYNVPDGELLSTIFNYSQNVARTSGDGSLIVIGTFSATFYLYEWNGTEYEYRWIRPVQDDWVTAVDVSDDGSTVACGTLNFENGQIAGGKFVMWDAESADVLIEYDEYGDEVSAVGLSADGRYAVVASWGQYGGTFGDVLTCFIRDTDIPIFRLEDDIDEPGSLFDAAISDSGNYAVAGGKAVHAREFGNGGMVYSIKINDPLDHDMAIASIDQPGELVEPGESFHPGATFLNVGSAIEDFTAYCTVTDLEDGQIIYTASPVAYNVEPFEAAGISFDPEFTVPVDGGRFEIEFSAEIDGDEDPANNGLSLILRSWHDLKAGAVVSPFDEVTLNWPMTPIASFTNLGSFTEDADILVSVYDSDENEVYSSVSTIFNLPPYGQQSVMFDDWTPDLAGRYRIEFTAQLDDDRYPDDNSCSKYFDVVEEMIYDDGQSDVAYWVGSYPSSSNRKFAQRFNPNYHAPFTINNVRFFIPDVSYNGLLDYVGVTSQAGGLPDTADYLQVISNPSLPGQNNWASCEFSASVENELPLWVVLHWPDQDGTGPYIGADANPVIDNQSYWFSAQNGWNQWSFHDWMIRMTIEPGIGIESDYVAGLPRELQLIPCYPNPFNSTTNLRFAMPVSGTPKLEIFNSLGQLVKRFANANYEAGYHTIKWDGRSDSGTEVASGVYYFKIELGNQRISQKLTLLK